jgi:hypothetical protein
MSADLRFSFVNEDLNYKINAGDIPVFDMHGLTYRHITKISLSTLRCYMKFTQEAFPVRLQEIHLINVSPVLSKLLTVLRPFMKERVRNMLNFHSPDSESFNNHISKEYMPFEYGGEAGCLKDIKADYVKQIESQR